MVSPDLSTRKWKNEDELEWCVERGIHTRAEADALHAEGLRAVDRLTVSERDTFLWWRERRPDTWWHEPEFPNGWDDV